jgi:hypothetical protein
MGILFWLERMLRAQDLNNIQQQQQQQPLVIYLYSFWVIIKFITIKLN